MALDDSALLEMIEMIEMLRTADGGELMRRLPGRRLVAVATAGCEGEQEGKAGEDEQTAGHTRSAGVDCVTSPDGCRCGSTYLPIAHHLLVRRERG